MKVKHVKPIQKNLQKFYVQVVTDARVKKLFLKYVLKRGPENLSDFANKFLKKKCFRRHFRENWQKTCHVLQILAIMDVGLGEGMNTSKKKKLGWKSEGEGVFSQRPKSVKHGKSYLLRVSQWLSVVSLKFKGYLEKFILYPDVMLQLLKKLKL